jgi:hypothetical protein
MKKTIFIEKNIENVKLAFQKIIVNDKTMQLKQMNGNKFYLVSTDNFGNFNMIEKEDYFISGQFLENNGNTIVKYNIRANATFNVLCLVIPLMSLPTIIIGLKSDTTNMINNFFAYFSIVTIGVSLLLYNANKLKVKGENQFKQVIKLLE